VQTENAQKAIWPRTSPMGCMARPGKPSWNWIWAMGGSWCRWRSNAGGRVAALLRELSVKRQASNDALRCAKKAHGGRRTGMPGSTRKTPESLGIRLTLLLRDSKSLTERGMRAQILPGWKQTAPFSPCTPSDPWAFVKWTWTGRKANSCQLSDNTLMEAVANVACDWHGFEFRESEWEAECLNPLSQARPKNHHPRFIHHREHQTPKPFPDNHARGSGPPGGVK
jgi:hypothetical protein